MRNITKGLEPASLTQHRSMGHTDYDNYADKDTLREHLVSEQRGLCCYCLSRIRPASSAMKIAHWHSQDRYPAEQLDYSNLLGACMGNEGQAPKRQHCDTRQGNRDLSMNPANSAHQVENLIRFEAGGTIFSNDETINDVLNLNVPFLKNNRKAALEAFKATLDKRGALPMEKLKRWLQRWNGESHTNNLEPFCQVVVYWLRKRLNRT